jgi:nitrogenase molybdenum-iron protein alpha/beta subunit
VEEVAREFQLDEIAPIAPVGFSGPQQAAHTQALLENLDELLGRLRQANVVPSRERKT